MTQASSVSCCMCKNVGRYSDGKGNLYCSEHWRSPDCQRQQAQWNEVDTVFARSVGIKLGESCAALRSENMALMLRIKSVEFDATRALLPQEFQALLALYTKDPRNAREEEAYRILKLFAYKKYMQQVEASIDAALSDESESDPDEVERLLSDLFEANE